MNPLSGWANFYVIVGSSAGALIGLQFVVITLIADVISSRDDAAQAGDAFGTPTIVHLSTALLLSAILCTPWQRTSSAALAWGALGIGGFVYEIIVVRRMRQQNAYKPELEDWIFHVWVPFAAYGVLLASACCERVDARQSLFGVATAALLLLFVGIHNAWDAVTYHVYVTRPKRKSGGGNK
jgi:hypothetical protein